MSWISQAELVSLHDLTIRTFHKLGKPPPIHPISLPLCRIFYLLGTWNSITTHTQGYGVLPAVTWTLISCGLNILNMMCKCLQCPKGGFFSGYSFQPREPVRFAASVAIKKHYRFVSRTLLIYASVSMRKRIKSNTRPLAVNREKEKQNALNLKNVFASFGFSLAYVYVEQTWGMCGFGSHRCLLIC